MEFTRPVWAKSYVYALVDPGLPDDVRAFRYVGKHAGITPKRIKDHAAAWSVKNDLRGVNLAKGSWVSLLPKRPGRLPYDFKVLQWYDTPSGASNDEERWIQKLRGEGALLLNIAKGGEAGFDGRRHSPETRAKQSIAAKKRYASDPLQGARVSESNKQRFADLAARERQSQKLTGRTVRVETGVKISTAAKLRWKDPTKRAQRSEITKRQWADPVQLAKLSNACKGRVHSPEVRAKMSASQKRRWEDPGERTKQSQAQISRRSRESVREIR